MGYQLIETIEVGSGGAASIEFTGIAGTGQDLVCLLSARTDGVWNDTTDFINVQFNSNSSSVYSEIGINGNGSSVATGKNTGTKIQNLLFANGTTSTADTFGNGSIYVSNYAASLNKAVSIDSVSEANATAAYAGIGAALFASTAAITTIKLTSISAGNFVQYSSASLYMITAD